MAFSINTNLYEEFIDLNDMFIWKRHENLGYPSHFHAAMELCFVLEGQLQAIVRDESYTISAGDIFICNPFEIHTYNKSEIAHVAVLIFSNKYLDDFKAEFKNKIFKPHLTDKEYNAQILALLQNIPFSFTNNILLSTLGKKAYVNLVLDKIISRYGLATPTTSQDTISNIISYIYKNYKEKITLDSLAKEFNYSKTSISRLLSQYLKIDLRCFVNNLRVEQSELLLNSEKYKNTPILQISEFCGFDSNATFYRAYKRRYDRLPRKQKI